jgi:hypothetical protein
LVLRFFVGLPATAKKFICPNKKRKGTSIKGVSFYFFLMFAAGIQFDIKKACKEDGLQA